MVFDVITIFPKIFSARGGSALGGDSYGYFGASIIKRALEKNIISINVHNLRNWTKDKHRTVDDTPYGGGAGMVLKVEPIFEAVRSVLNAKNVVNVKNRTTKTNTTSRTLKTRIILFSAKGKTYTQKDAKRLSKYDNLILICGRYEGVDERVAKYIADEEISIGDYILTGGELPAMVLVDSIARLLPGVLGNEDSIEYESHSILGQLEHPQYTKPENYNNWKVPKVLLSGNHKEIEEWRRKNSKNKK